MTPDTRNIVRFKVGTLGPHTVLPITISCPVVFSRISTVIWNLFSLKDYFTFWKAWSHRVPNLGCRGAESPGWFEVSPKYSAQDMMQEQARCCDEAANHQVPIVAAFSIIRIVSEEKCSSLMPNLMQIHCSTWSVILNATATQYTCSFNSVYCLHWLVQWSHHCSRMHIPVHFAWLPGYINVLQTVFIIWTMAGDFLERPHTYFFPAQWKSKEKKGRVKSSLNGRNRMLSLNDQPIVFKISPL